MFWFIFTDPPLDKIPVDRTAGEQHLQQQSKTAKTLLGDFNLNEAGRMVQKRRPAASILDEELLLSEDETENPTATKKAAADVEPKEPKAAAVPAVDKPQQSPVNKPAKIMGGNVQGGIPQKRKKIMNRSPSNSRPGNNAGPPMNMNAHNSNMTDAMTRDGGDLFMRKRNFMESDMGYDRPNDRGFGMAGNFMNDRNPNNMNPNNFGNNRDFGDDFSRRPNKNDGFNSNFGGNRAGANGGGGGRMFNRY